MRASATFQYFPGEIIFVKMEHVSGCPGNKSLDQLNSELPTGMAVQRRSVFPPLLKTYAEDASAVESPGRGPETRLVSVAASGGKKNPESNRSGTDVGRQAPPGSLQRRERKPAKKSVLRDSREAELRMKRAEVDACSSHKHCLRVHAKWCACQVAYIDEV